MSKDTAQKDLLPSLNQLVTLARSRGASGIELLHTELIERRVEAHGAERRNQGESKSRVLSGTVFLENGASASFSINADLIGRHPASVEKAVVRAKKAKANPLAGPPERLDINERGLGLKDPRYPRIDDEAIDDLIEVNQASKGTSTQPHSLRYMDRKLSRFYLSSRDYYAGSSSTFYKLALSNCIPGTQTPIDVVACGRAFSHVGSIPFGRELESRMLALSSPAAHLPSGPVHLVLPTRVMSWVLNSLAPAFNVELVDAKKSFVTKLENGIIGTRSVHVVDDPAATGGVRTRAFDDRGVPPVAVPIIREGRVGNWYQNVESAREKDVRPTGHTWLGKVRPSNLILRAGNRSRTQMLSEIPMSVEIDHLTGSLDLRTGHLKASGPALLLEKGKAQGSIRRVSLDMPIQTLLSAVKEIASNQLRYGAVDSATVLTEPLDVELKA